MNQRQMWTSFGLGALSIALIALPGSSSQTKETVKAGRAAQCASQEVSQSQIQVNPHVVIQTHPLDNEPYVLVNEVGDSDARVQEFDDPKLADDDNLQIFMGSGGGWLGVGVSEVSADKMNASKLSEERGALLGKIAPDSPAAKAGLKENDVVLEINGQRIEGTEQFRPMILEIPAGRTATLTEWRDARRPNIKVPAGKQKQRNRMIFLSRPNPFHC